jgi:RNA polymerase sigma factor (sigma-70 family)
MIPKERTAQRPSAFFCPIRSAESEFRLRREALAEFILQRVARGDAQAVRDLLDRYGGLVYALARRFCYEPGEIDDATQDIFLALWKSAVRFDPTVGSEETFVAMIARRRLIDRRRRSSRRLASTEDADVGQSMAPASDNQRRFADNELAARALEAMAELRPEQQLVLRLAIMQGLSHDQIAKVTGIPLGTVKTHVRRGLIALRESMGRAASMMHNEES